MPAFLRPGQPLWHALLHLQLIFCFLAVPPLAVLLPHWTIVWFYAGVIGLPLAAWLAIGQRPGLPLPPLWPLLLLFLWGAVSVSWTPADGPLALWLALRTLTTVVAALLLLDFCRRLPPAIAARARPWVLPGLLLAALLLVVEQASRLGLTSLLSGEDYGGPRWADRLNRGALAVLLHAPAAAMLLWLGQRRAAAVGLLAAVLLLLAFYRSETSLAAGAALLVTLALALRWPDRAPRLFLWLGIAALLLPLPLALLLEAAGQQQAAWLDITAQARVQIWSFTAERILERPVLGWGLDASDALPSFGVQPLLPYDEKVIPIHPHNGALQLWLELGLPGLLLGLVAWWRYAAAAAALPPTARAFLYAAAAALLLAQSLSFGLWQSRWLAFAFTILLQLRLLIRAEEPGSPCQHPPPLAANELK